MLCISFQTHFSRNIRMFTCLQVKIYSTKNIQLFRAHVELNCNEEHDEVMNTVAVIVSSELWHLRCFSRLVTFSIRYFVDSFTQNFYGKEYINHELLPRHRVKPLELRMIFTNFIHKYEARARDVGRNALANFCNSYQAHRLQFSELRFLGGSHQWMACRFGGNNKYQIFTIASMKILVLHFLRQLNDFTFFDYRTLFPGTARWYPNWTHSLGMYNTLERIFSVPFHLIIFLWTYDMYDVHGDRTYVIIFFCAMHFVEALLGWASTHKPTHYYRSLRPFFQFVSYAVMLGWHMFFIKYPKIFISLQT